MHHIQSEPAFILYPALRRITLCHFKHLMRLSYVSHKNLRFVRTSPGRSGAFGATETQYPSQKETHETYPYQRIFRFIINNLKQRHSGFFAVFGQHRRTLLYNAKKTGIQIRPAAMNAHFSS